MTGRLTDISSFRVTFMRMKRRRKNKKIKRGITNCVFTLLQTEQKRTFCLSNLFQDEES